MARTNKNSLADLLFSMEKAFIENALKMAGGNANYASQLLGMNRTTLHEATKRLGINKDLYRCKETQEIFKEKVPDVL